MPPNELKPATASIPECLNYIPFAAPSKGTKPSSARRLKIVLERELNLTHARRGTPNLPERCSRGGRRRILIAPVGIRVAPLHVVRGVEHFQAKLHRLRFGDAEVLDQREVDVEGLGPAEVVAGAVTELTGEDVVESGWIEVAVG